jgi:protein-L-isoaspartate(D-aspartate) O-methyltransferase
VSVTVADGREGHPTASPFDRIIVTACADEIRRAWFDQLKDGGLLELPLRLDPDGAAIQLIPVLERRGECLRSVALTWGGFMPLHGGDGGWHPPPATLSAGRSRKGKHTSLVSISGSGLERLSADAARALLASALNERGRPRRQGLTEMTSTRPPLFVIYLLLRIPASKRVSLVQDGRLGVGMIHHRNRSLAVVSLRSPWNNDADTRRTRLRWRLDAYGNDAAAIGLERLTSEWQELQRKHRTRLKITARPDTEGLRLSFGWLDQL